MINKLKTNPSIQKLITQYDHLPRRDQMALKVLSAAVFLFLIYFVIWRPAADFRQNALEERESAAALVGWLDQNRTEIAAIGQSNAPSGASSTISDTRSLMATVTSSANAAGLSLQRFEPSGETGMRVWIEDAPFRIVAGWLDQLSKQYGIIIDQAAMDRDDVPGVVSVRLTLQI